jgi:hypothetical protein
LPAQRRSPLAAVEGRKIFLSISQQWYKRGMRKRALRGPFAAFAVLSAVGSFFPPRAACITLAAPPQAASELAVQQQSQNPSSTDRKVKVWTNDDLIATRTPADVYVFEKEAQAAANDAAVFDAVTSCFAPERDEAAIADTRRSIEQTSESLRDAEGAVAQATRELQAAPANLKARNQLELDRRTAELQALRRQLRTLQDRLQQLASQPSEASSEETPSPQQ